MSLAALRTAIKAALESVSGIGVVTDYEPLTARQEDFERFFRPNGAAYAQGWTITREATGERGSVTEGNRRDHTFVIRGYRTIGSDAATEKAFQDLIESVCERLRKEMRDRYGETAMVSPPSVRLVEPRNFAGYLVHYAEIVQICSEWPVVVAP